MNIKTIMSIIVGIIVLNSAFTLLPLPGIITTLALAGAIVLLFMAGVKGGIIGKAALIVGAIFLIYALPSILIWVGISLPLQKLAFILGGILLIINPFINV